MLGYPGVSRQGDGRRAGGGPAGARGMQEAEREHLRQRSGLARANRCLERWLLGQAVPGAGSLPWCSGGARCAGERGQDEKGVQLQGRRAGERGCSERRGWDELERYGAGKRGRGVGVGG